MTGIKSALPIIVVAFLSVALMVMLKQNAVSFADVSTVKFIPYISMSLVFAIILTLAMRQALIMYVASIITLITIAHFYVIPWLKVSNDASFVVADTKHLIFSFIALLPIFGLIKIPAHKLFKSVIYLIGSLIAWLFFSYLFAKIELPITNLINSIFDSIGRISPFEDFWFTPLQFTILCLSGISLLVLVSRSAHQFYLLSIALLAGIVVNDPTPLFIMSFAILGSFTCLFAAIITSRNMAFNDELTGIPGRRSLTQYAEELSQQYSVVMIDIDLFKKFNDKYGHGAGDDVIKLVASKIAKTGNRARAFRYGGEEFTLVFDGKSIDEIRETIEDLRVNIETYPMAIRVQTREKSSASNSRNRRQNPAKEEIVRVTCSFGIAESTAGSSDFKAVIKRADSALYKAKKGGRNCVRTVNA